jgi:hypothetical protein
MKKHIFLISFLMSIFYAVLFGAAGSLVAEVSFGIAVNPIFAGTVFFVSRTIYLFFIPEGQRIRGILMAGVNQEIWIDELRENFYALDEADDPLQGVADWSEWVENNTINFASVGTDPVILKNNASWPITAVTRTDNALSVALDTYDSTTTRVRNVEEIEAKPDKLKSVVGQHKKQLKQTITDEALVNYAPTSNATATPVIQTSGATRTIVVAGGTLSSVGNRATVTDITNLGERFDILNYPKDRRLLLCPAHVRDIRDIDAALFKDLTNLKTGEVYEFAGFKISKYSQTPTYTKSTYAKKAYGAAVDLTNDVPASIAYCPAEMMKCLGTSEMFYKEKSINPEQRAHEVGFQMRAKCAPIRSAVAIGAIVTARA